MTGFPILSVMLAIPAIAAIACLLVSANTARWIALLATLVDLLLGIGLWVHFDIGGPQWQFVESVPLFGRFSWSLGIDGFALMLIMLSVFLMPICIGASWVAIEKRVQEYMAAFLVTELLMIGTFAAQDLFLFYIFFEAGLIPMYLIIGIWGGANRIYASYKFFLYTLLGSVLMLIAMLWMVQFAGTTSIPVLLNKWYWDELYDFVFVKPAFALGRLFWKAGDEGIIDRFGPNGSAAAVKFGSVLAGKLQSGYVYVYAFVMLMGLTAALTWVIL